MTGTELAEIRARLGLSQTEFAGRLGIHSNSLARWERGEGSISELAASKGLFWKYMDTVMQVNATERIKSLDGLFGVAVEAGLDREDLLLLFNATNEEQKDESIAMMQLVTDDMNLGLHFGIKMTPTFVVYAEGVEPQVVTANMLDMTLMSPPFRQIIAGN